MTYFLEAIASHIYKNHHNSLDKQLLVFPNIRAGLYFLKYFSSYIEKPVWAPKVQTINEVFKDLSSFSIAENEQLIFELYRIYRKLNPGAESFDEFYFWGEMLLNDFDDADKYLVDAASLFSTIRDIKKIDAEFGSLTPEQVKAVRQFWVNFEPEKSTKQKDDFLGLWKILPLIYDQFRTAIMSKNLVYEGIIYRDIADKCKKEILPDLKWETIHFIGFNALNACERVLMKTLKKNGKAKFYWDYDNSYVDPKVHHSAGFFIRQNLTDFGNDMPAGWEYDTFVSNQPSNIKRKIIETSSDISQVKLLPEILSGIADINGPDAHHTAIVLADENLLIPLISSVPDYVENINITMGYPLKFSPVYSLIQYLISLQLNSKISDGIILFDHQDVINLLKHNYLNSDPGIATGEILKSIIRENRQWVSSDFLAKWDSIQLYFRKVESPASFNNCLSAILKNLFVSANDTELSKSDIFGISIRNEFIYKSMLAVNRLDGILAGFEVEIRNATYFRLLDKVLRSLSVPFSGEPLNGIQIMGILETRTLDFKNLVILSVNEGILPKSTTSSSFIPYNLREAFGLPTIRHQDSIYAYYFYRLLERSENVFFIYNSNADGLRTGEKSRLLLQLDYLNETSPDFASSGFEFMPQPKVITSVKKTNDIVNKLRQTYIGYGKKALSPSAVNTWLNCSMRFYYKYVCGLKEPDKVITEIDPALFGELLHNVMKQVYTPYQGIILNNEIINGLIRNRVVNETIIKEVIKSRYPDGKDTMTGSDIITSSIILSYVELILKYDATLKNICINSLEKDEYAMIGVRCDEENLSVNIGGVMDRVDSINGMVRVVDYKTGSVPGKISSLSTLFDNDGDKRIDAWFQLLMYCEVSAIKNRNNIVPSLYCMRRISDPDYSDRLIIKESDGPILDITDYTLIREEFSAKLAETIGSIFDSEHQFEMTSNLRMCGYCPYNKLCQR